MDEHTYRSLGKIGIDEQRLHAKDLSEVDLSHAELTSLDLRGFTITKANFEYADLSGSDLRCVTFASANFVNAFFVGADLRGANLAFGYFHNADFCGADLRGARIADALCSESNFVGADLRGAHSARTHYAGSRCGHPAGGRRGAHGHVRIILISPSYYLASTIFRVVTTPSASSRTKYTPDAEGTPVSSRPFHVTVKRSPAVCPS